MRAIHKIYIGIAILLVVMSVLFSTRERFRKIYAMELKNGGGGEREMMTNWDNGVVNIDEGSYNWFKTEKDGANPNDVAGVEQITTTHPKQDFMEISIPAKTHLNNSPKFDNVYNAHKLRPIPFISSTDYDATTAFNAI